MVKTSGAKDKNKRKRRKPTGAEKKQQQERANATRREKARKEREAAERDRPAANFFQPHSVVQQQTNNDGNSDDITDSATNITHSDITAVLDVEEGEDDGHDEDDVDEDEDGNIINNNKNNEGTQSEVSMREVLEAVQTMHQQNDNDGRSGDVVDSVCVEGAAKDGGDEENNDDEHHLNNNVEHNQNEDEAVTINIGTDFIRYITHINDAIATMHATANVISLDAEWNVTLNRYGYPTNTGKLDNENALLPQ